MNAIIPFVQPAGYHFYANGWKFRFVFGLFIAHLLWIASLAWAETLEKPLGSPQKGPLISELKEDLNPDLPGPETLIRKYEDASGNQVVEFSINGSVFQYQVIPHGGVPYYLVDKDGDGLFENRFNGHEARLVVPQWVLFKF
ncbi:MAG: DUF2782 domain-containing protein [Magnetococcus sp. DMHC-6]